MKRRTFLGGLLATSTLAGLGVALLPLRSSVRPDTATEIFMALQEAHYDHFLRGQRDAMLYGTSVVADMRLAQHRTNGALGRLEGVEFIVHARS